MDHSPPIEQGFLSSPYLQVIIDQFPPLRKYIFYVADLHLWGNILKCTSAKRLELQRFNFNLLIMNRFRKNKFGLLNYGTVQIWIIKIFSVPSILSFFLTFWSTPNVTFDDLVNVNWTFYNFIKVTLYTMSMIHACMDQCTNNMNKTWSCWCNTFSFMQK